MSSSLNLIDHFPYVEARPIQKEALQTIQDNWDKYDVFVLIGPTAFGKSAVARTLMNALNSVSCITPTNLLVDQMLQEFPDTPTLSRLDKYRCEEWKRPCSQTRARLMKFCKGCQCGKDLSQAKFRRGPGIYNYHTYMAHKLFRDVLVVDEAHNLLSVIRERLALRMWRHDYRYPSNMWKPEQVKEWVATLSDAKRRTKKVVALKEAASYQVPEYVYQRTKEWFNGKGTTRNEPEERELIKLLPVDVSQAPPIFWPQEVQKIILMSATIGPKDIEQLGLSRRRVCYIACKSPIPAEQRPVVPLSLMSVNRTAIQDGGDEQLAEYITKITNDHPGEKGIVHVTYQLSALLRERLTGSRYIFHDRDNKGYKYKEFRDASPESGRVLVACGLYEGIDLPEDAGRWQVIAKIPWQSLASPAIKHLAELDPEWYIWDTLKTTIQACGRICRTPEDYGTTFILDTSFWRLIKEGKHLIPEWFLDALVSREDTDNYRRQLGL